MSDIFLSYAHEDRDTAGRLAQALEAVAGGGGGRRGMTAREVA